MIEIKNIKLGIRKFITTQFSLANTHMGITDDSSLLESGIIDSLGVLDLVIFLEEEFQIIISDEDMLPENFESISNMTQFIIDKNNFNNQKS